MLSVEKKTISEIQRIAQPDLGEEPFLQKLYSAAPLHPIENRAQYRRYLSILEFCLAFSRKEKLSGKLLKSVRDYTAILSMIIGDYEKKRFKLSESSQGEILKFLMEQHDLTQKDLASDMGGQPAVSNVLNGRRLMNVRQIDTLSKRFHISPGTFFP